MLWKIEMTKRFCHEDLRLVVDFSHASEVSVVHGSPVQLHVWPRYLWLGREIFSSQVAVKIRPSRETYHISPLSIVFPKFVSACHHTR